MNFIKEILRGIVIGVANIIPGVSGGTMAVSMGVYDKIIGAVNHLRTDLKKSIITLFPYLVGMLLGVGLLSFVIGTLFEQYPFPTSMTFIGLILGGVPAIMGRIKGEERRPAHYLVFVLFFAAILLLQIFGNGRERQVVLEPGVFTAVKLFLIGILASATMVIPGVSGSMILMLLGVYAPILNEIRDFLQSTLAFSIGDMFASCMILVPFGLGVLAGIVLIAKLISFLLENFKLFTYMAILGLVFVSPIVVLLQIPMNHIGVWGMVSGICGLFFGILVAMKMTEK